jgi:hypothetical protein
MISVAEEMMMENYLPSIPGVETWSTCKGR